MDQSPSTPGSATRPATTPRHLKRLSLNTASSPFSPSSPSSSPLSHSKPSSTSSPVTSLARSDSARRALRLSTSSPISASSQVPDPTASSSPSTTPLRSSTISRLGSPSLESPTLARTTPRNSAHARRTSSISYSRSPTIGSLPPSTGGGASSAADSTFSTAAMSPRGSPNPNTTVARGSFEGGRPRPSLDGVVETVEGGEAEDLEAEPERVEAEFAHGNAGESAREELPRGKEEPLNLGSGSALGFVNAQATLIEQNADLLSFIAKKERKCLDLREELKRHESELALLKKKWESIVARSFQQQQSTSTRHGPSQSVSTVSSASPNTSPTPRSASLYPLNSSSSSHPLDLSLLSTTFDASGLLSSNGNHDSRHRANGSDPQIEIPESVKAAGNWLGGALGRVLEAAVGMPPPAEAPGEHEPLEGRRREREGGHGGLESLREEAEEEEEEDPGRRRISRDSSTETESMSESGEKESTAASSVQEEEGGHSSVQAIKTSPLRRKPIPERSSSPLSTSASRRLFTTSSPNPPRSSSDAKTNNTFPPSSPSTGPNPSTSPSHTRTRSSLASFGEGWSSTLNKRWTNLTESETFKNSKRATLGLVDTFEQGLAQALGPLEPPSLSPSLGRDDGTGGGGGRRSSIPSPFLGSSASSSSSPNPNPNGGDSIGERRLTEVPISPMPGQALSSMFASWSKGKEKEKEKESKREEKGKGKARESNGFDWSAFQEQKEDDNVNSKEEEEVEDWPAW